MLELYEHNRTAYYAIHGNTNVPVGYVDDEGISLYQWTLDIRKKRIA